jgi:hypothetical protein
MKATSSSELWYWANSDMRFRLRTRGPTCPQVGFLCRGTESVSRPVERSGYLADGYQPSTWAKISGATIVASDSTMNFGVSIPSLPQVIFSFGTAPE